jgi:Flp pilus assembly protein TadG
MLMVVIFAFTAFVIDVGYISLSQAELQNAADAAAHAGVLELATKSFESSPEAAASSAAVSNTTVDMAELNLPGQGDVISDTDVEIGVWDYEAHTFTETLNSPNAVKATVRRSAVNGNPLPLFFAPLLGHNEAEVIASAIAAMPPSEPSGGFRFLIDDEMFDTDEPAIESLARARRTTTDNLLRDGNGDGFIDLPPDTVLELPTGQQGDEALFDRESFDDAFPFTDDSRYTLLDFLCEGTALERTLGTRDLQDATWPPGEAPHTDFQGKKVLDPTTGIDPVDSHADILALPNPDRVHVSPVFKSDVAMQERDPTKYGSPTANLLGERRGLVAFLILSARNNPKGGSYLPLLTIKIVSPSEIDLLTLADGSGASGAGGGGPKIVQ